MDWLLGSGILEFGLGLLLVGTVLYQVHKDLTSLIGYLSMHGRDSVRITFVGRRSAQIYYILFIITGAVTAGFLDALTNAPVFLIALSCIMIGFMIEGLLYRVFIVSEEGLGQIVAFDRLEIVWQDIKSFSWNDNRLQLELKSKGRTTIRFHDASVIVELNEKLKARLG